MERRRRYYSEAGVWAYFPVMVAGVLLLVIGILPFAVLAPWMFLIALAPFAAWGIYIGHISFKYAKWDRLNRQLKARRDAEAFRPQRTGNGTRAGLCSDDPQGIEVSPLERWSSRPQIKIGPRGGAYTEDIAKDGRPYRRYF